MSGKKPSRMKKAKVLNKHNLKFFVSCRTF